MESSASQFYFASQSAMLFALFLDNYEIVNLTESLKDVAQSVFGGRNTVRFGPELELASRTLYYTCSLLSFGRTPGQSFCDFTMVKSSTSEQKQEVARKVQTNDLILASLFYSVLPYLYQRKDVICKTIGDVYEIITTPERLANEASTVESGSATAERSNLHINSVPANESSHDSFVLKFLKALRSSVASIAATNSDRVEIIFRFMADVHRFLFLHFGRFLELPLRLVQLRLVTKTNPKAQASLKSLSWLVAFRISLLVYYATRVLLADVDRELNTTPAATNHSSPDSNSGANSSDASSSGANCSGGAVNSTAAVSGANGASGSAAVKSAPDADESTASGASNKTRCSLCIDTLTEPAVVPCGHIFCWECILRYSRSSSCQAHGGDGHSGGAVSANMKCPICRTEFPSQKIRALYNYL